MTASLDAHRAAFDAALAETLADGRARAVATGPESTELWDAAVECLGGGKMLRPRILLSAAEGLTGSRGLAECVRAAAVRIAVALELLHFAFLLHDDVIDGDLSRRGGPNLIGVLRARSGGMSPRGRSDGASSVPPAARLHWARSAAILVGDLMLSTAHGLLGRLDLPAPARERILDLVAESTAHTVAGENLDVLLADGLHETGILGILEMEFLKTGSYSIALPLRLAAVLAGRTDLDDALVAAGRRLGTAYQLQDDLLSTFGDPAAHGKDALSDLREGKQTVLIALARRTPHWERISARFGAADLDAADAATIRAALEAGGARDEVERMIAEAIEDARRLLRAADLPAEARDVLDALIAALTDRSS